MPKELQMILAVIWGIAAFLLLIWPLENAQSGDIPSKVEFQNTQDLPNGIAFHTTLMMLAHFAAGSDRKDAISLIRQKLRMNPVEANAFLDQLHVIKEAMEEEAHRATLQHACSDGEAYQILDELYYVEESVYERFYEETKYALGSDKGALLEKWMSEEKVNIGHSHIDFKKKDEQRGTDSTKTLTILCDAASQW